MGNSRVLPRGSADDRLDMLPHHLIKGSGESIACLPPVAYDLKAEGCCSQRGSIEILMGDRITPQVQFLD